MVITDTPFGGCHVASWYEDHMCIKKAVRGLSLLIVVLWCARGIKE